MKRILLLSFTFLTILASGCKGNCQMIDTSVNGRMLNEKLSKKSFNLKNFHGVSMSTVADVEYVQSTKYSIVVTASERFMKGLGIKVNNGILKIYETRRWGETTHKSSERKPRIKICSPCMDDVNLSGVGTFQSNRIKAGTMKIKVSGVSKLSIGQINCDDFQLESSGVGTYKMNIRTRKAKLNNNGNCKVFGNLVADDFRITNSGSATFNMTINGSNGRIDNLGTGKMSLKFSNVDLLRIKNQGVGNMNIDFSGKKLNIQNQGNGKIMARLDCDNISACNPGVGKMVLSGKADNVNIQSSGISNIDTSKLNNY